MLFGNYVKVNITLVIMFTFLYKLTDLFMYYFAREAEELDLGEIREVDSIIDLFHISLVTQTTVGYTSIHRNAMDTKSLPFKIINYIQLISIFMVNGYFLDKGK